MMEMEHRIKIHKLTAYQTLALARKRGNPGSVCRENFLQLLNTPSSATSYVLWCSAGLATQASPKATRQMLRAFSAFYFSAFYLSGLYFSGLYSKGCQSKASGAYTTQQMPFQKQPLCYPLPADDLSSAQLKRL
jgi:hypothetical protein